MKILSFLELARRRWHQQQPDQVRREAGDQALDLVAAAYATTPDYNYQLHLDELAARVRTLEADLVAERTAALKRQRQHEQALTHAGRRAVSTRLTQAYAAEQARLKGWLSAAENDQAFTHERLQKLQNGLRRRLAHVTRHSTAPPETNIAPVEDLSGQR